MRTKPHIIFCSDHYCTDNGDILNRAVAGTGFCFTDLVNDIHAFHHVPKDRVFGIEEVVVDKVDEELGAPGVWSGIRHRDCTPVVPVGVRELILDHVTGSAPARAGRVATLQHKPVDDPVEDHAVIEAFFHERFKVARSDGHSRIERQGDVTHVRFEPDQFLFLCCWCHGSGSSRSSGGCLRRRLGAPCSYQEGCKKETREDY